MAAGGTARRIRLFFRRAHVDVRVEIRTLELKIRKSKPTYLSLIVKDYAVFAELNFGENDCALLHLLLREIHFSNNTVLKNYTVVMQLTIIDNNQVGKVCRRVVRSSARRSGEMRLERVR